VQRRALAAKQLDIARAAVASGDPARRSEAMQAAGRALGLDPESEAAALIGQLMTQPPKDHPKELTARLEAIDSEQVKKQSGFAARAMLTYFTMFPVLLWMGVLDWMVIAVMFVLVFFNIFTARSLTRFPRAILLLTFTNALLIITAGRIFGPFLFVPMLFTGVSVAMITSPLLMHRPQVVIATMVTAYLAPVVLEAAGVWNKTWDVVGNQFTVTSSVVQFEFQGVAVFLTLAGSILLIVMPMFVRSIALAQRESRRQAEIQSWHLRQLLPKS
jgi:hypothetical protein